MANQPVKVDPYIGKFDLTGILDTATLATLPDSACARGKNQTEYGQNLYISDVSDDEIGTAFVGRKRRSRHIRSPTFAEQFTLIIYMIVPKNLLQSVQMLSLGSRFQVS